MGDNHELTTQDISKFIELTKTREELKLRLGYLAGLGSNGESLKTNVSMIKEELDSVNHELSSLSKSMSSRNLDLYVPGASSLSVLNDRVASFSVDEVHNALKSKSGDVYDILKERSYLLKQNFENRDSIAKLNVVLFKFHKTLRESMEELLENASEDARELELKNIDPKIKEMLSKVLRRLGYKADIKGSTIAISKPAGLSDHYETCVAAGNRTIWVAKDHAGLVKDTAGKIAVLSARLQLFTAERQVRTFTEKEEQDFSEAQKEYLGLLNERDRLLHEYYEEERICSL